MGSYIDWKRHNMKRLPIEQANGFGPFHLVFRISRFLFKGTKIQHMRFTSIVYRYLVRKFIADVETLCVNFRGMELVVEGRDITLLPTLVDQTYERYEIDWFLSLIASNSSKKLFIDVGANIGIYTTLATRFAEDHVYCIAIEPDTRNLLKLEINVAENNLSDRVQILSCAIGVAASDLKEKSERNFFVSQYGATSRLSSAEKDFNNANIASVQVKTLDQVFKNCCVDTYDLVVIKVDVEGFEPEVLMSGLDSIRVIKPYMLVEFSTDLNREFTIPWTLDFLTELFHIYSRVEVIENNKVCIQIHSPEQLLEIPSTKLVNLIFTP